MIAGWITSTSFITGTSSGARDARTDRHGEHIITRTGKSSEGDYARRIFSSHRRNDRRSSKVKGTKIMSKQECIPVGRAPPTCLPYRIVS